MQYVINGIVMSCIITLGSAGFTLIYGILRFPNLTHGELMILGAYIALSFNSLSVPLYASFLLALLMTALACTFLDKIIFKKLRSANLSTLIMASFGASLFLRNFIRLVWGTGSYYFNLRVLRPIYLPFGAVITIPQLYIVGSTILLVILLGFFLKGTRLGKAMRAVSDNVELSRIIGINTEKVITLTWILGGFLAASGGIFLGIDSNLNPLQGWRLLLPVYAATIFGGVGNIRGALFGGLVMGLAQEGLIAFLPGAYKPGIAFGIIILIIYIRSKLKE